MFKFNFNSNTPSDSNATQASKYTNYVNNGNYVSIQQGQVQNILQIAATPLTATIQYTTIGQPDSLAFTITNNYNNTDTQTFSTLTSPYMVMNLQPNSTYDITAVSIYTNNSYSIYVPAAIRTINEGPVSNITFPNIQNKSVTVSFVHLYGIPSNVDLTITDISNAQLYTYQNVSSPYRISPLTIDTSYSIQLLSTFSSGNQYSSLPYTFQTLKEDIPVYTNTTNITNTSATIHFTVTGSPIQFTTTVINVNNDQDTQTNIITLDNPKRELTTFTNLTIGAQYTITIKSTYISGNSFLVQIPNAFTTLLEDNVQKITILNITGNTIYFSFTAAIGFPIRYIASFQNTVGGGVLSYDLSANITQNISLSNIQYNTSYFFRISSIYPTDNRYNSNPVTISTLNEGIIDYLTVLPTSIENQAFQTQIVNSIGNPDYFEIRTNNLLDVYDNHTDIILFSQVNNPFRITNLQIDSSYGITVTSIYASSNNRYIYTYPQITHTLKEGSTVIKYARNTTINSTNLTFLNIYGNPSNYLFDLSSGITKDISFNVTGNGNAENTVLVSDLNFNTSYKIYIQTTYPNQHTYLTSTPFILNTKMIPNLTTDPILITDSSLAFSFITPIVTPNLYRFIANTVETDFSYNNLTISNSGTTSTLAVSPLTANTGYDISFQFYYADISTNYNTFFHINTKGPVQNITFLSIQDIIAVAAFTPPLVLPDYSYNYLVTNSNTVANTISNITQTSDISFSIPNLIPNTSYSLDIFSNYIGQSYPKFAYFSTKDKPRNMNIGAITDISAVLSFTKLISQPDIYFLQYNYNQEITIPATAIISDTSYSYYYWSNLITDNSYNGITLTAHYNDFSLNYISDIYPIFFTKSAVTNIYSENNTNINTTLFFTIPNYTTPDYYLLHFITSSLSLSLADISFSNIQTNYTLTELTDNTSYTLTIASIYDSIPYLSTPYTFQTYGTPTITSFINIYDTYLTINTNILLLAPLNYTLSFLDIEYNNIISQTIPSITTGTYTVPQGLLTSNTNYQVTIAANYTNNTYRTLNYSIKTKGPPVVSNIITTDISANIYINEPAVAPTKYDYFLYDTQNNLLESQMNIYLQLDDTTNGYFFRISNLIQNTAYNIQVASYYSDISFSFISTLFAFQTGGPPTNLAITNVTNTQMSITFTPPFNCFNYTITALYDSNIPLTYSATGSPYTLMDLSENLLYTISVVANYPTLSFSSTTVQATTIAGLQILSIENIRDTSLQVTINNAIQVPNNYSYNLQIINGPIQVFTLTDTDYTIGPTNTIIYINGLTPNTNYTTLSISEYFADYVYLNTNYPNMTLTSNNTPIETLGISNIVIYTTDISATVRFPVPYINPSSYSYQIGGTDPTLYTIEMKTDGINNFFLLSNLTANTLYTSFIIYSYYDTYDFSYNSGNLSFITKQIPTITNSTITDTSITVTFTTILAPVHTYSYTLQSANVQTVTFLPSITNTTSTVTIPNLITNTYFPIFTINAYYSDIQSTYSSINTPFSTLGPVLNPMVSISTNTLTFFPPYAKPDYYIITNTNDVTLPVNNIVYDTSMTYFGNQYYYPLSIRSGVIWSGINVVPYFGNGVTYNNKNLVINSKIVISSGLVDIATNQTGKFISACETTNIYISSDYGTTWTTKKFNTNISKIVMDICGQNQYALYAGIPSYVYVSNNYGISWLRKTFLPGNRLSSICTDSTGKNVFVGATNNGYIYVSNDFGNSWNNGNLHSVNSIGSIMNNHYIYNLDISAATNTSQIMQLPKIFNNGVLPILITIPGFSPISICSNQENTRFIAIGTNSIYISKDGINWRQTYSNTNIQYSFTSLKCDNACICAIAIANNIGMIVSIDSGITWNVLLPTINNIKQVIISGDGKYIYAYDSVKNFYSYRIPDAKGNVTNISASNITNTSLLLSAFPPSYVPDFSYNISAINTISPYDSISISSNKINNIIVSPLQADGSYNIQITTNYAYPEQTFPSKIFSVYTRNAPAVLALVGNVLDISATIQFQAPKAIPDSYILQDSSGFIYRKIYDTDLSYSSYNQTNYYTISGLVPNTFYLNVSLASYYSDISTAYTATNNISFYTRGSPYGLTVSSILDTSLNISFYPPENTIDISSNAYTIIATNQINPYDTHNYLSNNVSRIPLSGLNADGSYNITVTANYMNPVQTLISTNLATYTKSAPTFFSAKNGTITDVSAIFLFQPPKIPPTNYILDISNTYYIITTPPISAENGLYSIVSNNFVANTRYLSNISLISYYSDTNTSLSSSTIPSFITEGSPSIQYLQLDISATIFFTTPYQFPSRIRFQVYNNKTQTMIYDISENNPEISSIHIPNLDYNTYYTISPQSIYTNAVIIGDPYLFYSRSAPLNFQIDPLNPITDISVNTIFTTPFNIPDYYQWIITDLSNNTTQNYTLNNTATSFGVGNLYANGYFSIVLESVYNTVGLILPTNTITFHTKGSPTQISITSINNTNISLTFQPPFIIPEYYNITIQNQYLPTDRQVLTNIGMNITIVNLLANSTYNLTLTSVYSSTLSVSTNLFVSTEGSPTLLPIFDTSNNDAIQDRSATIFFTSNPYPPIRYQYVLQNIQNNTLQTIIISETATTSFTIYDLIPNQRYSVFLNAEYINTIFSSNTVSFYTKDGVQNIQLPVTTITDISAVVRFKNAAVIPPYPYQLQIDNGSKYFIPTIASQNYTYTFSFSNLQENTAYPLIIESSFNTLLLFKPATFITEGRPINFAVNSITDVSAIITFQPLKNTPKYYYLNYTDITDPNNPTSKQIEIKNYQLSPILSSLPPINNIQTDGIVISSNDRIIWVYDTSGNKYVQSLDAGITWLNPVSFVESNPNMDIFYQFVMNESGNYLYSSNTGIYYSLNAGTTWTISNAPTTLVISQLVNSRSGNYAIAIANPTVTNGIVMNYEVKYSLNYGKTWNSSNFTDSSYNQLFMSADGTSSYILTEFLRIYKSSDYGTTWYNILDSNQNLYGITKINKIYVSIDGTFLFIIVNIPSEIYTSIDGGNTWIQKTYSIPNVINNRFTFSQDGTYSIRIDNQGLIYYSTDYANTWIQTNIPAITSSVLLNISNLGDYVIVLDRSGEIRKIYIERSTTPSPTSFSISTFIADSKYEIYLQSQYDNASYNSQVLSITTYSAPYNITTSSNVNSTIVSFQSPSNTTPLSYTVNVYDTNNQLYETHTINSIIGNTEYSISLTNLDIRTNYTLIISSNYPENISIYSDAVTIYTIFNPVIYNIFYTINDTDQTFNIIVEYSTLNTPDYYLLQIDYPEGSIDVYDTNETTFEFFNLMETGNYTITVTSVYPTFTLNSSSNIYVNNMIPVSLDSYSSTINSITINYTITDITLPGNYIMNITQIINSNPLQYSTIIPKTQYINSFTYSGLIVNSGSYEVYISYGGDYSTPKNVVYLVPVQPNIQITDISAITYNSIKTDYTIQYSYNTIYFFVLQNTQLDISYNIRILPTNTFTTIYNLYYDSGTYKSSIRAVLPNIQFDSSFSSISLPFYPPIQIQSFSSVSTNSENSISITYTLYNTYQSTYTLFIINAAYPTDISFILPIANYSTNFTFSTLPYYNVGKYQFYMDVSYANGIYDTSLQDISMNTVLPITLGTPNSNADTITIPFQILPTYQSSYYLTLQNRGFPTINNSTRQITTGVSSFTFGNIFYNSGTYDISMTVIYSGFPGIYTTPVTSITLTDISLVVFGTPIHANNSIYVPFTIFPSYQDSYTLTASNTTISDISYTISSVSARDTSYNFTNLYYNSGTYDISMTVNYSGGRIFTTTPISVSLSNITPVILGTIQTTQNSITVPYTLQNIYKPVYTISATHSSITALNRTNILIPDDSNTYVFSDLYYNSGSYNVTITVSYNNGLSTFTTPPQTVFLLNATPITVQQITNTATSVDISYSFLNMYQAIYNIFINNTTISALNYTSSLDPNSSHYTQNSLFYNSGTYRIFLTVSYNNGNTQFFSTDLSTNITLPFVNPVTITNVSSSTLDNYNTIIVNYDTVNMYLPVYIIRAVNSGNPALNYSSTFVPPSLSSSNSYTIPSIYYNSGTYLVSIRVSYSGGVYDTSSSSITFSGSTIATVNTATPTTNTIAVNYNILPTYNSIYTIYAVPQVILNPGSTTPPIPTLSAVIPNNIYTNTYTLSGFILDTNNYNIYIVVSYGIGLNTSFQSNTLTATLVFIAPIQNLSVLSTTFTSVTVSFYLPIIYNATYSLNLSNIAFPQYAYNYQFTNNTITNYTFSSLNYNSGRYSVIMTVLYNSGDLYRYSDYNVTPIATLPNYSPIATVFSVVPSFNSLVINYSVLPLIGATCILSITNSTFNYNITVSATSTSYTLTGMIYNSGTYSVVLSVAYSTGSTYYTPAVYATLPFYNFIQNGGFSSGLSSWGYYGTVYTVPNNGGNNIPYINNGYANSLMLQWNQSNIYQNVRFQGRNYTLSFSYVAKNTNPKGAVLQVSISNGYYTTINIPKTAFYFSWNTFYVTNIYVPDGFYFFKIYLQVDSGQNVSVGIANVQIY